MLSRPKRIIICAERRFPRGDAGANRVLYIARALIQAGHELVVVSIGENRKEDYCEQTSLFNYQGVDYKNVPVSSGIRRRFDSNILSGFNTVKILKELALGSDTTVIIYTTNPIYGHIVSNYCLNDIKAEVVMDVVEKFQPFQYPFGRFDPKYLLFSYCFKNVYPKAFKVIAISKHLEDIFCKLGRKVIRLPALIDPADYVPRDPFSDGITRLIYSGDIGKKEALEVMLKGIILLSKEEKKCLELYFTRTTKDKLTDILGKNAYLIDQLSSNLIIMGWLSYESLIELYKKIDFLFFARNSNEATVSNFPSKVPELLSCGIPIIANRVGDFHEYLEDGVDSILFNNCTPTDCCTAIRRAINLTPDHRMEMIKNARKCAEQNFDYRKWSDKIHSFFQS